MENKHVPNVGHVPDLFAKRDAIHVAVVPVTAAFVLSPGQHVGIVRRSEAELFAGCLSFGNIGIVDPFLTDDVKVGQRLWLFLYPNTITSLRHVWTHPAFPLNPKG